LAVANPRGDTLLESIQSEAQFLKRLAEDSDICGAILWYLGGEANLPGLERLRAMKMPMVFVDRRPPNRFLGDYVGVDNRYAACQVVNHLVSQGHRRIAHITNEESACTVAERLAGYQDALQDAGIPFDADLVLTGPFQEPEEIRYTAIIERLRELSEPATAIFAVNDYSALCLVASAGELGLCVPQDIEIAGFDDLERWRPGPAMITTASQPFERMGVQAAGLLLERMEATYSEAFTSVIMDAPLVVRAGA
jgi:DNA-binding LacI/PurR family transcriptional regulator